MKLDKNEVFKLTICLIIITTLMMYVNSQVNTCKTDNGCILRTKFFSYVSFQSQEGQSLKHKSSYDNKVIYVYSDRLVFYSSEYPLEIDLEIEANEVIPKSIDDSKIERIIYFSEIILDCGKFNNNLCHAKSYPHINLIKTFKLIKTKIPYRPEIKCLVIPFFENSYKVIHDKVAYICIQNIDLLLNLIKFKHTLSRAIELYQIKLGNDRFNSFNGILRKKMPFIYFKNNGKAIRVIASLYGKKIDLVTNDENTFPIKTISLYQFFRHKCLIVKKAIEEKLLTTKWNYDFNLKPEDDCCVVFPSQKKNIFLCAVSNNEMFLERASDICEYKLKSFINAVKIQSHAIELSENNERLLFDKNEHLKCKAKHFYLYNVRVVEALKYAALNDCKLIYSFGKGTEEDKLKKCRNHYSEELELELKLLSGNNNKVYHRIVNCVKRNKIIEPMLKHTYLSKLLEKNKKKTKNLSRYLKKK